MSARAEQGSKKAGRQAASSGKRAAREAQSAAQQAAPSRGGLFGRAKPAPVGAPSYSQPSVPPSASAAYCAWYIAGAASLEEQSPRLQYGP